MSEVNAVQGYEAHDKRGESSWVRAEFMAPENAFHTSFHSGVHGGIKFRMLS